jgi:arylsulfatase A-like enzyme
MEEPEGTTASPRDRGWGHRARRMPVASSIFAGLALMAACGTESAAPAALLLETGAPVVMIVADTLAASHLGFYGYDLDTSPFLDELASKAFVFDGHSTQCNSTIPSMTSILTGLYPRTHRTFREYSSSEEDRGVETPSLAERFQAAGYYTIAIWSHPLWETENKSPVSRGWDLKSRIGPPIALSDRSSYTRGDYTNERLFAALNTYELEGQGKPLFLWLHYFDPHTPYEPASSIRDTFLEDHLASLSLEGLAEKLSAVKIEDRRAWLNEILADASISRQAHDAMRRALYDAEILTMDSEIRIAAERLQSDGMWDDALVVFMADHGENVSDVQERKGIFFTHGRLFEDVVRTPLLLRLPGQEQPQRVGALTQNIDLLPTLVDLMHLPEFAVEGKSLLPLLIDPTGRIHDQIFVESVDNVEKAVRTSEFKYIDAGESGEPLLYQWKHDVLETHSLVDVLDSATVQGLSDLLNKFILPDLFCARWTPGEGQPPLLSLSVPLTPFDGLDGIGTITKDGHGLLAQPQDSSLEAELRATFLRLRSPLLFEVSLDPTRDQRVYVGRLPLSQTTAIPLLVPSNEAAPEDPIVELTTTGNRVEIRISPSSPAHVAVELRYVNPTYSRRLSLIETQGFGSLKRRSQFYKLQCNTDGEVRALVQKSHINQELYILVRIDGAWPALDQVAVNGRSVDRSRLRFVFPLPPDGRITSALLAGPPKDPPPGALLLWMDSASQRIDADESQIDPELLKALQELGYVK